ncbi:hypothetical protein A8C32_10840 [Flavivirga aquatica]|uniref:Secretion system C-terminal sorting domain-containing protein n=1 Tax=Flavivirga aquatica TaxID=1849968 RepID=A0A1E5TCZ5_9FLAO|nr:T9SS type A sorting domain-containing protein [Flavivirga aquatica]OEK09217.1 hypothetical protein A8C32_10840 [Flavivirga aquatica]
MKTYIALVFFTTFSLFGWSQITFNGAHPLFDNQNFTFNFDSVDGTGRNIYTTSPIDGNQPCGGIGVCELMIAWNDIDNQWEILADDGNGDFLSTFVIFKNTEESIPNPPSIILGTWEENTDLLISGQAGGNLTMANTILIGDVQDSALNVSNEKFLDLIRIYPNPVENILNIKSNQVLKTIDIYDVRGKTVLSISNNLNAIDISKLYRGLYFLKIKFKNFVITKKIMIN